MNNLNGKCVNVVLAVEMGRGMAFLDQPVKILANFNGRPLESDLVEPDDCPLFNTELVWETEKRELRKVRSTNAPIRVEVQLIDKNQRRDRIGFLLLSPRCASIIPFDSKLEIPFKWHKLLGVAAENKSNHPELYLSLTIRDIGLAVQEQPSLGDDDEEADATVEGPFEKDGEIIPIKYLPDGFIQIGNDNCDETFLLSVNIQVACHLDLLLPEVLVFNQSREKYHISFRMFGITIKSKPFCRDLHANIPMNEKIIVRIRSEYDKVRTYLSGHCQIMVCFYCGRDKLGMTDLQVDELLKDVSEDEFLGNACTISCEQKCFFKFPSAHGMVPCGTSNRQPFIEVAVTLTRAEVRPVSSGIESEAPSLESVPSRIDDYIEPKVEEVVKTGLSPRANQVGCGDKVQEEEEEEKSNSPTVSACGDQNEATPIELDELPAESPRLDLCQSLPSPSSTIKPEEIVNKINLYQQYCLDVVLENVTLKKFIRANKLCFKFKHPKASSVIMVASVIDNEDNTIGEDIMLENARCKMFFISTTEHIRKMVYAWAPKLILTDETDQILTEELDLYTAMFLAKHRTECSYITEWKALRTYEPLAKISITMYLHEYGLDALPKPTCFDLLPLILDEEVALKELQDLQEWKMMQKAQFSADLKIVEKQRMHKLQKDWAKRKKELEDKLSNSVLRCQSLAEELQAAANTIRTKRAIDLKELELNLKPNCTFEDNLEQNNLKYSNCRNPQLIETISKLERDNEHLKGIINDQRQEIQQIKKTALTKEQTTNLLQQLRGLEEKFEDAQKAKTYFKDQWKKAVREIHDLKSEEQKQIQEKLQNHKIELSQLSLDSFVPSDMEMTASYEQNKFVPAPFGDFKWDNSDYSLRGSSQSVTRSFSNTKI